ncbi:MAG: GNAT family N-acetyltransferase [Rhizobiaceae bacterium]
MASIDSPEPTALRDIHIDGAMALVNEAGWNQLPFDWRLMRKCGDAIVLQDLQNGVYATALALPYSGGFGWISMVLVTKAMQRKGLATHLLTDRIAWLCERNLVPILDATEAGEKLYEKLGFAPGIRLARWQGQGGGTDYNHARIGEANADCSDWIERIDTEVFGAKRSDLIDDFINRAGSRCFVSLNSETGFAITRQGERATHIGPVIASCESEAIDLLDAAIGSTDGPVFFDLQENRLELGAHMSALGFKKQRAFVRMSLGDMPDFDGKGRAMIIAGPEYG